MIEITYPEGYKMWYRDIETYEKWCEDLNNFWNPIEYELMFGIKPIINIDKTEGDNE